MQLVSPYTQQFQIPILFSLSVPLPLPTSLFQTSRMPSLLSLHPESKDLFAFTWIDPDNHCSQQLTWTVLPQGFCDSLHCFSHALASDLTSLDLTPSTVLQYVDDLLLCSPSVRHSQQHYIFLNFLADQGYRVSHQVSSLCSQSHLSQSPFNTNKIYITTDRKSLIFTLPLPTSKTEILSFQGLAGYLHLWIPNSPSWNNPYITPPEEVFQNPQS